MLLRSLLASPVTALYNGLSFAITRNPFSGYIVFQFIHYYGFHSDKRNYFKWHSPGFVTYFCNEFYAVMKKITAFFLLISFAALSFDQAIIVFNFYINQSYIAANQCENRYRPMLHCNGQCQLAKKLKQEERKDQQNPERKIENKNEIISSRSFFVSGAVVLSTIQPNYIISSDSRTIDRSFAVFHPPCV